MRQSPERCVVTERHGVLDGVLRVDDYRVLYVINPAFSWDIDELHAGFLNHFFYDFIAPFPVSRCS